MFKDDYKKANDSLKPDEKIINAISAGISESAPTSAGKIKKFPIKRVISIAASIAIVLSALIVYPYILPDESAKKPRRIEQKTVLLIRDGDRTALHKRPAKGLLAGLYELPNVEGHLTEDALPEYIRSIGFEPLRVERLEDSKHIFTHLEWHMKAFEVTVSADFDGFVSGNDRVKILGNGAVSKALQVKAHAFSKSAEAAIAAAGGSVEKL